MGREQNISHATPPHLVKVKINFDEAKTLTWKETKCLYGVIKTITLNHMSELLKMQLESRSRNVHIQGTGSGFGLAAHLRLSLVGIK